ncbi:MAG: DUF2461 family protein [Bacteroidetes bacterium]|nr:DUF2461 family protein [Bacteroidota bacterium]MDA1119577.1 DUF2461 family protein [Bacteroidota bacterium]
MHIKENLDEFSRLLNDKKFKDVFGEIHGEQNERLSAEFQEIADQQPLIANKGFYYFKKYPADLIFDDKLIPILVKDYQAASPLNQFLKTAILGE